MIFFLNIFIFLLTHCNLETLFDELAFSYGWDYEFWDFDSGVMLGKKWLRTHCCSTYNSEYFTSVLAVSQISEHVSNSGCEVADIVAQNAEVSDTWIFIVHAKIFV
jgi:hypothetical protein